LQLEKVAELKMDNNFLLSQKSMVVEHKQNML
jgi:hypothetical protein